MTAEVNRQDQIVYRFYLKTVGVLVDARLTHHRAAGGGAGDGHAEREPKVDKWFNLPTPDPDLFRSDLAAYKTLSTTYSIPRSPTASSSALELSMLGPVPPLLIAFTLDTVGVGQGAAALWYRREDGRRIRVDPARARTRDSVGSAASTRPIQGIVLEQWTLQCASPASSLPSSSTDSHDAPARSHAERPTYLAPSSSSAYKSGIIHFRALYQYIRLLPAYALFRRLRGAGRGNTAGKGGPGSAPRALKIGIKMWVADGWGDAPDVFRRVPRGGISDDASTDLSDEEGRGVTAGQRGGTGVPDAWARMEDGLVGLDVPISALDVDAGLGAGAERTGARPAERITEYDFPVVPISNGLFSLSGRTRANVDFWIEDAGDASAPRAEGYATTAIPIPGSSTEAAIATDAMDLSEEYFTPTLARRRTEDLGLAARPSSLPNDGGQRRIAGLSATRPVRLDVQAGGSQSGARTGTSGASVPGGGGGAGAGAGAGARVEGFTAAQQVRPQITTVATTPAVPYAAPRSGETSPTIQPTGTGSSGSLSRWAGVGQGLPFAVSPRERADSASGARPTGLDRLRTSSLSGRSSPNAIAILSRRQSSHGSRSNLLDMQEPAPRIGGGTPPTAESYRGGNSSEARPGSSLTRTGSFSSQTGRSFTRLAELPGRPAASSAVMGTSAGSYRQLVTSPVSGSFQRSSSSTAVAQLPRPPLATNPSSPAQLPPTFEEDSPLEESSMPHSQLQSASGSPRAAPQMIKRYSASLGQRAGAGRSLSGTPPNASSGGSSGEALTMGTGAGGSPGVQMPGTPGSLRRTSTRGSFDAQGSLGNANRFLGTSLSRVTSSSSPGDGDEINLFLKTLDTMPRPPSIAASASASRPHLPSTSSSLSATHTLASVSARNSAPPTPALHGPTSPLTTSSGAASGGSSSILRRPLTKTALEEKLRGMADSYAGGFAVESAGATRAAKEATTGGSSVQALSSERRPSATRLLSSFAASYVSNRQATDAVAELMSGGTAAGLQPRTSPTTRDVSSLASRPSGSSVKSSSPLAGAPILAQPPTAPPSPANALGARDAAAAIALPPSPAPLFDRQRSYAADQVDRTMSPAYLSSLAFTPLRPEDVPLPGGDGSPIGSRHPSVDAAASRDTAQSPRRAPVLIRGGFQQFATPATGGQDGFALVHHHTGNGGAAAGFSALSHRSRSSHGERSPMSMPERDPLTQRERDNEREYLAQLTDTGMTSALRRPGRPRQGSSDGRLTPAYGAVAVGSGPSGGSRLDRPISPNVWLGPPRLGSALSAASSPSSNEAAGRSQFARDRLVLPQIAQEPVSAARERSYGDLGAGRIAPVPQPYRGRWTSNPVDCAEDSDLPSPWDEPAAGAADAEVEREADADDGDGDGIVGRMEMGERRTRGG